MVHGQVTHVTAAKCHCGSQKGIQGFRSLTIFIDLTGDTFCQTPGFCYVYTQSVSSMAIIPGLFLPRLLSPVCNHLFILAANKDIKAMHVHIVHD